MKKRTITNSTRKKFPLWGWIILAAVLLGVIGVFALQPSQPQTAVSPQPAASVQSQADSLPSEITVEQAKQKQEQGAYFLDVREQEEWNQFHIPGAVLIPLGQLPDRLNEVPKDREVVVVCRSGRRSAQGRDILLKAGYTKVTSMAGGVTQWQAQGYPIATGQ